MSLIRTEHKNGLVTYQSPLLNELKVKHGFSTRIGGASKGAYANLNLDLRSKDANKDFNLAISENFRRLRAALDIERIARVELRQVHGNQVFHVSGRPTTPANAPCVDSAIYDKSDRVLVVRTADCVPVLLASCDGKIVSDVHAGWRGVVAGVVANTIKNLKQDFDIAPDKLIAAIGPCISSKHFEVGEEVAGEFEKVGLGDCITQSAGAKPHINLRQAVFNQLENCGINSENIDTADLCTFSMEKEFFSHRRDNGKTGRMAAVIVSAG